MKRWSAFGFTPVPATSASTQEKRPKITSTEHSSQPSTSPTPGIPPQPEPPCIPPQPEPPTTEVNTSVGLVRNDIGTYSLDQLKILADDDKFWLLNNACRPSSSFKYPYREEYGKNVLFSIHGYVNSPGFAILRLRMVAIASTVSYLLGVAFLLVNLSLSQ